ncbi:MAG: carboxypeptidase-like regulatory domain-containing protein [Longimicrobiaceae bacterium]
MKRRFAPLVTALAVCIAAPVPAAAQVIVGRVVDAATGGGVPRARVTVAGVDHRETRRTLTGDDGRFTVEVRGGGSYRVQVARTGYQDASTRELAVGADDTVAVELRVVLAPRRLDPVVATTPPRRLSINGVYDQTDVTPALLATAIAAEGGRHNVTVRGAMVTPSACWRLSGGADRIGPLITLAVNARPTGATCPPDSPGASTYKVTVRGIPPGTYTLRVLHTYRDEAWPRSLALDTTVTVR